MPGVRFQLIEMQNKPAYCWHITDTA